MGRRRRRVVELGLRFHVEFTNVYAAAVYVVTAVGCALSCFRVSSINSRSFMIELSAWLSTLPNDPESLSVSIGR